ncbi:MAG: V-type ATP synthase subunit E [Candidatus Methanofastidiosia archaeon]
MGIEDIKKRILTDATKKKEEILAEARKKAQEIQKEGEITAQKQKESIIDKAENEATQEHHTRLTMEKLEARKQQLEEKQKVIDTVFERSLEILSTYPEYTTLMESMILDAATGGEQLILSPKDYADLGERVLKRVNQKLDREISLADETHEMTGGFILRTPEMEINESFEEKIRALRDEMEAEVARTLFEG